MLELQIWRLHCWKHPEICSCILWQKNSTYGAQNSSEAILTGKPTHPYHFRADLHLKLLYAVIRLMFSLSLQVLYNNKGYHSMPTYLNVLNNAILRANLPKSKGNPAAYGETLTSLTE